MPDSTTPFAPAIQAHFAALQSNISREAAAATSCKQWCAALVTGVLLALMLGQKSLGLTALWALAPAALLILLDAQYRARERFWSNAAADFAKRLHGRNGKGEFKDSELLMLPQPPAGAASLPTMMIALGSVAVWPFYAGLAAAATMVHMETAPVLARPMVAANGPGAGCGSGGCGGSASGCGSGGCSSGGCGSGGGCGASCGGAKAKPAVTNFVPRNPNGPMLFPNGANGLPKVINARPVINRNALPPNGAAHPAAGTPNAAPGTKGNPIVIPIPASSVTMPHQTPPSVNAAPPASPPQQAPASGSAPASSPPAAASPAPASTPPAPSAATPSPPLKGN